MREDIKKICDKYFPDPDNTAPESLLLELEEYIEKQKTAAAEQAGQEIATSEF